MADGVSKGVQSLVIGRSRQLSLNKFFYRSTPSMRKGRDGKKEEKKKEEKKKEKEKEKEDEKKIQRMTSKQTLEKLLG